MINPLVTPISLSTPTAQTPLIYARRQHPPSGVAVPGVRNDYPPHSHGQFPEITRQSTSPVTPRNPAALSAQLPRPLYRLR